MRKITKTLIYTAFLLLMSYLLWTKLDPNQKNICKLNMTGGFKDSVKSQQIQRRTFLQEYCNNQSLTHRYENTIKSLQVNHQDRLLYCSIPKVGCTFLKRLLYILDNRNKYVSPFDIAPFQIHNKNLTVLSHVEEPLQSLVKINYKTFLFVRNPYKRLFSGYVDKLFTPQKTFLKNIGIHIIKKFRKKPSIKSLKCGHDITFHEFILYVLDSIENGTKRNDHFLPMYQLCAPCELNYDVIGHVETFREDLLLLIKPERLEPAVPRNYRMKAEEDEIWDAVSIAFRNIHDGKDCFTPFQILQRIWFRLQIRNILSVKFDFPLTPEKSREIQMKDFHELLLNYLKKSQKDPNRKNNKIQALAEALRTVPLPLLKKLQLAMEMDCKLFGYDCHPDYIFNSQKYINKKFKYFRLIES